MTTQPSSSRQTAYNTLIADLKSSGIWDELDALYLLAAHDKQAAFLNIKQDAFNLTEVVAGTFTVDAGWAGNATSAYLDTGFNPATDGLYALDDAHMGVITPSPAISSGSRLDIGNNNAFLCPRNSGTTGANMRTNVASTSTVLHDNGIPGSAIWSRTASASFKAQLNGGAAQSTAQASGLVTSLPFYVGAINNVGSAGSFSNRQLQAVSFGSGLTDTQLADWHTILNTYLASL